MKRYFVLAILAIACRPEKEKNVFSFCRDFAELTCLDALKNTAVYPLEKSKRNGTMRDFWNSVYFRGDRLAFELRNADARRLVDFDCLYGHYYTDGHAHERHELEYIELKENNVYGLVMLGSLLEKRFAPLKEKSYRPPTAFSVTYSLFCRNDLLARDTIMVEMR